MIKYIVLSLLLMSCTFFDSNIEIYDANDITISVSQYIGSTALSKAVVPYWDGVDTFSNGTLDNYPLTGQSTTWTVIFNNPIYEIKSTTIYPLDSYADILEETYYMLADKTYVDASGNPDSLYRKKYETTYRDGTRRREQIIWDSNQVSPVPTAPENTEWSSLTAEFKSIVKYNQGTPVNDSLEYSTSKIDGYRFYANVDGVEEHIWLKETGSFKNAYIDSIRKKSVQVVASIHAVIKNKVIFSIEGEYILTDSDGNTYTIIFE